MLFFRLSQKIKIWACWLCVISIPIGMKELIDIFISRKFRTFKTVEKLFSCIAHCWPGLILSIAANFPGVTLEKVHVSQKSINKYSQKSLCISLHALLPLDVLNLCPVFECTPHHWDIYIDLSHHIGKNCRHQSPGPAKWEVAILNRKMLWVCPTPAGATQ